MEKFNKDEFLFLAALVKDKKLIVKEEITGLKKVVKYITICDTHYELNIVTEES
jgi:hypothetical protein